MSWYFGCRLMYMQSRKHGMVALKRGNWQCARLGSRGRYRGPECMAWKFQFATEKSQGLCQIGSETWVGTGSSATLWYVSVLAILFVTVSPNTANLIDWSQVISKCILCKRKHSRCTESKNMIISIKDFIHHFCPSYLCIIWVLSEQKAIK